MLIRSLRNAALPVAASVLLANGALAASAPSLPTEQQAIVQSRPGGPATLTLQSVPVPQPSAGQVLVRIYAASVNPADWAQLQADTDSGADSRRVPGLDVAGVIAAIGPGVTDQAIGEPVFGMVEHQGLNGGYAHYAIARATSVTAKPANVSYAQAAGLGVVGVTALRALDLARVSAGQRVLITGVAGGVGSTAAQAALARGATVLGTASPSHDAYLHGLGVTTVIDYHEGNIAAKAGSVDAVIDTVGGSEALQAFHAIRPGGYFVSIARAQIPPSLCVSAHVECFGSPGHAAAAPVAVLKQVAELARQGKLRVHVNKTFPLNEAAEAVQYVHAGHTAGKVVLAVTREGR